MFLAALSAAAAAAAPGISPPPAGNYCSYSTCNIKGQNLSIEVALTPRADGLSGSADFTDAMPGGGASCKAQDYHYSAEYGQLTFDDISSPDNCMHKLWASQYNTTGEAQALQLWFDGVGIVTFQAKPYGVCLLQQQTQSCASSPPAPAKAGPPPPGHYCTKDACVFDTCKVGFDVNIRDDRSFDISVSGLLSYPWQCPGEPFTFVQANGKLDLKAGLSRPGDCLGQLMRSIVGDSFSADGASMWWNGEVVEFETKASGVAVLRPSATRCQ